MLRRLRWWLAKRRLASLVWRGPPPNVRVSRRRHRQHVEDFPPNAESYEQLASVWTDYASWYAPDYGRFLASAGLYHGQPIQAVLDLACGTGVLSRQLACRFDSVVGLDLSGA